MVCNYGLFQLLTVLANRPAVQPRVLVALIQCATIATEVVEVVNESEEDVRFRYSGKKFDAVYGFLAYFCAVLRFSGPPYAPLKNTQCRPSSQCNFVLMF